MLFSSSIKNNTQEIFLLCDELKDAKEAVINSKLYEILGVVCLNEIKNWDLIKGHSKKQTYFQIQKTKTGKENILLLHLIDKTYLIY